MALKFKSTMTKAELLEIAAANGIEADDAMTKAQIIAALEAYNAQDSAQDTGEGNSPTPGENAAEDGTEGAESGTEGEQDNPDDTDTGDTDGAAPQDGAESQQDGADDETGITPPRTKTPRRAARRARRGTTFSFMPVPPSPAGD